MEKKKHIRRLMKFSNDSYREYCSLKQEYGAYDKRTLMAFSNFRTFRNMLNNH